MHTDCSGGGGNGCPKNEVSLGKQQAEERDLSPNSSWRPLLHQQKKGDNKGKRNMTEAAASAVILDKETGRGEKEREGNKRHKKQMNEKLNT